MGLREEPGSDGEGAGEGRGDVARAPAAVREWEAVVTVPETDDAAGEWEAVAPADVKGSEVAEDGRPANEGAVVLRKLSFEQLVYLGHGHPPRPPFC